MSMTRRRMMMQHAVQNPEIDYLDGCRCSGAAYMTTIAWTDDGNLHLTKTVTWGMGGPAQGGFAVANSDATLRWSTDYSFTTTGAFDWLDPDKDYRMTVTVAAINSINTANDADGKLWFLVGASPGNIALGTFVKFADLAVGTEMVVDFSGTLGTSSVTTQTPNTIGFFTDGDKVAYDIEFEIKIEEVT